MVFPLIPAAAAALARGVAPVAGRAATQIAGKTTQNAPSLVAQFSSAAGDAAPKSLGGLTQRARTSLTGLTRGTQEMVQNRPNPFSGMPQGPNDPSKHGRFFKNAMELGAGAFGMGGQGKSGIAGNMLGASGILSKVEDKVFGTAAKGVEGVLDHIPGGKAIEHGIAAASNKLGALTDNPFAQIAMGMTPMGRIAGGVLQVGQHIAADDQAKQGQG